jgi:hypothetical protein
MFFNPYNHLLKNINLQNYNIYDVKVHITNKRVKKEVAKKMSLLIDFFDTGYYNISIRKECFIWH